jgi:uncharacterized protein GlcG (DUF336 family)
MAGAEAEAIKNNWAMTIVILTHEKAYTACAYRRPTKALQDALAKGAADWRYLTFPRVIAADGGLPIVIDGKIVGAIGVSGATGPYDAGVGQACIDALK